MTRVDRVRIEAFLSELGVFVSAAEAALEQIQSDPTAGGDRLGVFSQMMFAIRGSAQQLGLARISSLAELGEEIALKAQSSTSRPHVRKAVAALWDALTTVRHLIQGELTRAPSAADAEIPEEEGILTHRLQSTLVSLGGARPKISADELEALLKSGRV